MLLAQHPQVNHFSAHTIRQLCAHRHRINAHFRQDIRNIAYFMELMRSPSANMVLALKRMNRYGILAHYLPDFGQIVGQMQYDLYHLYTVDAHCLNAVERLYHFTQPQLTDPPPLVQALSHEIDKPELAYIAALYHDLGKGKAGDHAIIGARLMARFCEQHRLGEADTQLLTWLIRHHLALSTTAQRRDISDPRVIQEFAQLVGSIQRLNYLYLLTVADIQATHPRLWNSWRAELLRCLYLDTRHALEQGDSAHNPQQRIQDTINRAIALLHNQGIYAQQAQHIWGQPGDDYFLRESAENIAWQTAAIARQGPEVPLVAVDDSHSHSAKGTTQIFIYAPDRQHLFADLVDAMEYLGLTIYDARIMTSQSRQFTLNTFIVTDQHNRRIIGNRKRIARISDHLLDTAASTRRYQRTPRLRSHKPQSSHRDSYHRHRPSAYAAHHCPHSALI